MADHQLVVLTSASLDVRPVMATMGILGAPIPGDEERFAVGARFFDYFVPSRDRRVQELTSQDTFSSHDLLSVTVEQNANTIIVCSALTEDPKCGVCHQVLGSWHAVAEAWYDAPTHQERCAACGHCASAADLDWNHTAGFGRTAIRVWGVTPGELDVSDTLVQALQEASGTPWQWTNYRL